MTEEQKRRAMLAYFAEPANHEACELAYESTIDGIPKTEHIRIFEFLKNAGCVDGEIHRFLEGNNHIIGNITSKGLEIYESNLPFYQPSIPNQTFNINNSTNVAAGNQNTIEQTVYQNVKELVNQINNSTGTPTQKEEAKGLLRQLLEHPLVAAIAGSAIGLL